MKESVVEHLVCPSAHSKLELRVKERKGPEVTIGELVSAEGNVYPVVRGLPHFINRSAVSSKNQTEGSFSNKWNRMASNEMNEASAGFHKRWFLERNGFDGEGELGEFLSGKSLILDAGAGLGRLAVWFGELTAAPELFAVDISESIYHADGYTAHLDNVHCIRGDITSLPFADDYFEYIVCDQVIHHTPDPEVTFLHLVRKLKKGGIISCYVYRTKGPIREFCDDLIRERTTEMTPEECMKACRTITKFGKSLAEMGVEIEVPEDLEVLGIEAGKYDLQRFFYWHIFKCFWNPDFGYDYSELVNFDWYHPKDAFRYMPEEFKGWYESTGLEVLFEDVQESGVTIVGRKK